MPLILEPIGILHTVYADRFRAPRQPGAWAEGTEATIELNPGHNFEQALEDLVGIERIWVITWFHRNDGWRTKVLPPRGSRVRRGVFATRSPHRPNPLGLSLLRLLSIRGRILRVADADLLDGTPVLDIKPYLPAVESHPTSAVGWIESAAAGGNEWDVSWNALAAEQTEWLAAVHGIELRDVADRVLAADPSPHAPYRRIERHDEAGFQLAIKSWRLRFRTEGRSVEIARVASGYAPAVIKATASGGLEDDRAHREFHERWPEPLPLP